MGNNGQISLVYIFGNFYVFFYVTRFFDIDLG